jgi:hypothetical protein
MKILEIFIVLGANCKFIDAFYDGDELEKANIGKLISEIRIELEKLEAYYKTPP